MNRGRFWILLVLAIAAAVRLATWREVFTPDGVRFVGDSDTYYHVLRARRIVEAFPRVSRFDAGLDYPVGAKILWPPLFDYLIAVPALLLGGSETAVEHVAAVLPLLLGVGSILLLFGIGLRLLGPRAALVAALLMSLSPAHVAYTSLGRPDQHAAEILLALAVLGAFVQCLRQDRSERRALAVLGVALALSFWNWQGSGVTLAVLGLFTAAWHVLGDGAGRRASARALALGAGAASTLLAVSLTLTEPSALRDLGGKGVTAFHVLLAAATGAYGALLWIAVARRAERGVLRRLVEAASAAALTGGLLLAIGASGGMRTNLDALLAGHRWYEAIAEFQPLTTARDPWGVLRDVTMTTGLMLLCAPLGLAALRERWRSEERSGLAFLAIWGATFLAFALARTRFALYLSAPLALWVGAGLEWAARRAGAARLGAATPVAAAVALCVPSSGFIAASHPVKGVDETHPALAWLAGMPPAPGREAVLADWDLGHIVQYFARRPVLTSPFGVDGGERAMEDAARFYLSRDDDRAEAVLRERRIGYLLVESPPNVVWVSQEFAPEGSPEFVRMRSHSGNLFAFEGMPAFWSLPLARLYFRDGSATARTSALGGFRLVYETPPTNPGPPAIGMYKMFAVVPGASLRVAAAPGSAVTVAVPVMTNTGRAFTWSARGVADSAGWAVVRVPFATGMNGFVVAGAYSVADSAGSRTVSVMEDQITHGQVVTVAR